MRSVRQRMKEVYIAPELKLVSFLPTEELALNIGPIEAVNERFNTPAVEGSDDLDYEFP